MQFADIKNDVAFCKNFSDEQKTAPTADKYQWSKEELKAYDNVTMKEQDERGEKELVAQKARDEKEAELIFEMNKEGFTIPQIASVTRKSEEEVKKILDFQVDK